MKKCILIIGILWFCSLGSFAQMAFNRPYEKKVSLGIKGGVNMPRMLYYHNPALMRLPQSVVFTPTGGVFLDVPLSSVVFLVPEVAYVQRGTDMKYVHQNSGAKVHYWISTSYVDLRLPLEICWEIKPIFQPYVFVGAEAGLCLFGQIHPDRQFSGALFPEFIGHPNNPDPEAMYKTIDVDSANMSLIHVGAYAGVGVRSKVSLGYQKILLKFSVSFHQGFLDSYSPCEKSGTSQAVNVNAYQITGNRLPQGMEVTLGIAIPLEKHLEDACATFAHDRYRRRGNRRHLFGF